MNILFVLYQDFASNSAIQVFQFANELVRRGHRCTVAVPMNAGSVEGTGAPLFTPATFAAVDEAIYRGLEEFDLIHAWTPREVVRIATMRWVGQLGVPYLVHLEDNEERILADALDVPLEGLKASPGNVGHAVPHDGLVHPLHYRLFLSRAAGVSLIVDRLAEFVPAAVPSAVVWPAVAPAFFDPAFFDPADADAGLRRRLAVPQGHAAIVYPGNCHASNQRDMQTLYAAIGIVNRDGPGVTLLRLGTDYADPYGGCREMLSPHVVELGQRPSKEMPGFLSLADLLVQPGRVDSFNDYRLPAKLPEFLASARPVILPRANVGRVVEDGRDAIVLAEGGILEMVRAIRRLLSLPDRGRGIGLAGQAFARRAFGATGQVDRLEALYERALSARASG